MKSYILGTTSTAPSTSATQYDFVQATGADSWNATEATRSGVVPNNMTIDNLNVFVATAPGSGKSYAFTLMKNGVATALTCTISDTNVSAVDNTHSVSFSAGDTISLQVTPSGTPGATGIVAWYMRQTAPSLFGLLSECIAGPTAGTNYLPVQGRNVVDATETNVTSPIPTAGVIKNLYVKLQTAPGTGKSLQFTLMKNGSTTALTTTINDTNTSGNDTSDSISVTAGDTLSIQVVASGTPASGNVGIGLSFVPTTDGESFLMFDSLGTISTTQTRYEQPLGHGAGGWSATETNRVLYIGATTVKALYILTTAGGPGTGKSVAATLRNELADTAAAVTITDTNTTGNITGQSIAISDNNRLSLQCAPTGTPAAVQLKAGITLFIANTTTTQTQTGIARIQKTVSQTITGLGRILATTIQTISGVARIQQTVTKTITGLARITTKANQTITGISRIQQTVSQTTTGKARILVTTVQTTTGKARVGNLNTQTITGRARISAISLQTTTGKSRIQQSVTKAITAIARIQQTVSQTITGKARVVTTVLQTITGRSRVASTVNQTITGKSRLVSTSTQTTTGRAAMRGVVNQTITGKARIAGSGKAMKVTPLLTNRDATFLRMRSDVVST